MNNALLKFSDFEYGYFRIKNYNSINLYEIKIFLSDLDKNYFVWIKLNTGETIEKAVYDYYGNDDYYDLILFLNEREMLFDMPYSYDYILNSIDAELNNYTYKVFGTLKNELSENAKTKLTDRLDNEYSDRNQHCLYMKVIKREYINEIQRKLNEMIENQKDMYSLIEDSDNDK